MPLYKEKLSPYHAPISYTKVLKSIQALLPFFSRIVQRRMEPYNIEWIVCTSKYTFFVDVVNKRSGQVSYIYIQEIMVLFVNLYRCKNVDQRSFCINICFRNQNITFEVPIKLKITRLYDVLIHGQHLKQHNQYSCIRYVDIYRVDLNMLKHCSKN